MPFSFLSRFRIHPDKEQAFLALAREMEALAPGEEGTLAYKFYRLDEPGMFAVYESFIDEAADRAHMEYAHNKPLIERMIACMDGLYTREMLFDLQTPSGE